jgi:hypothetical protein
MKNKDTNVICILLAALVFSSFYPASIQAIESAEPHGPEEAMEGAVKFSNGLISVQARDMRPEDLMKELGEKCAIKIVLYGDVFTDAPVSVQFKQATMRLGVQRILRLANIKNFLMHFAEGEQKARLVQVDLIGKKGGQRELTSGTAAAPKPNVVEEVKTNVIEPQPLPQVVMPQINKEDADKFQQNFLNMMDQILEQKFEQGEEPDPATIIQLFNDLVPPDMRDKLPPEVLEQMEKLKE